MADKAVVATNGELPYQEIVEVSGHIIDSLLLPKIMDEILTHGGVYELQQIEVGQKTNDPSYARIKVLDQTADELGAILELIHDHGATPLNQEDCSVDQADMDAAFPETFYSTTNHRTQVRWQGQWQDVQDQ